MGSYIFKPLTIGRLIRIMTTRHMLHHCVRDCVVPGKWVKALAYFCLPLFSTVIGHPVGERAHGAQGGKQGHDARTAHAQAGARCS